MSKMRIGAILGLLAAFAMVLVAAGCGDDNGGGGDTKESGKLIVGSDIPYPPFEQGKAPKYTGFDIDMINAVAKKLDLTTQIEDTSFDTIFQDEQAGKFDIVASATTITPHREKQVTFSDPYFDADQSLMVQKGGDIKTVDDLTSGSTVGVQLGTTGQDFAEQKTDATVQKYPEIADAFNALQSGQVDGVINDFPVSAFALKKYPELDVVQTLPTGEKYGFPMQKTNTGLIDDVNGALSDVIDDGTYEDIYKKWFAGKEPPKEFLPSS
jgi:polar amino acid transport system substrate-binding protein